MIAYGAKKVFEYARFALCDNQTATRLVSVSGP